MTAFGVWAIPTAVVLIIGYGLIRGVRVFEVFLEGAKEGLEMSWRILPALVALVVAWVQTCSRLSVQASLIR